MPLLYSHLIRSRINCERTVYYTSPALPIYWKPWATPPCFDPSCKILRIWNWWSKWPKITTFHKVKKLVDLKLCWDRFWLTFFKKVIRNDQNAPKVLAQQLFNFCVSRLQQALKAMKNAHLTIEIHPWTLQSTKVKKLEQLSDRFPKIHPK